MAPSGQMSVILSEPLSPCAASHRDRAGSGGTRPIVRIIVVANLKGEIIGRRRAGQALHVDDDAIDAATIAGVVRECRRVTGQSGTLSGVTASSSLEFAAALLPSNFELL